MRGKSDIIDAWILSFVSLESRICFQPVPTGRRPEKQKNGPSLKGLSIIFLFYPHQ
jgi:hypothetical protein